MTRFSLIVRIFFCAVAYTALGFVAPSALAASTGNVAAPQADSGWQARIVGNAASPQKLVAVDKKEQTLFLFERHSPLRLAAKYACTTGQSKGDKFVEGDLKTPEGVYFVKTRLASGLNFEKYGYEAYTLNYPNPVDKLRRKTGYGIWIHGRGVPITPFVTEGCVSLNNPDIAVLGKELAPGTPVALAHDVRFSPTPTKEDLALLKQLHQKTYGWAKSWSSRSKKFFDYYDADAYSVAQGESFKAFRQQKERVFKAVTWIDAGVSNVQVLQGPGYWVTWFQQDYRASNLTSKGVRRLYWQKDKKGELRIVGMEWAPHLYGTLTAGLGETFVGAEEPVAVAAAKQPLAPAAPQKEKPAVSQPAAIVAVADAAKQPSAPQKAVPQPVAKPVEKTAEKPTSVALADAAAVAKVQVAPRSKQPSVDEASLFVERWRKAWEKGDLEAYSACYTKNAVQGGRTGAAAIRAHKRGLWKRSKPKRVALTNIRVTSQKNVVVVEMYQTYTDSSSFADMGIKTLHLQVENNTWRIAQEDWSPL